MCTSKHMKDELEGHALNTQVQAMDTDGPGNEGQMGPLD